MSCPTSHWASPDVEIGIARRRARRIDTGDFEPDAVFESQFEPLVTATTRPLVPPSLGQSLSAARKPPMGASASPAAEK